jgi:hypothetical protein
MRKVCQGICCSGLVDFRESELARCARKTEQDAYVEAVSFYMAWVLENEKWATIGIGRRE